MAASIELIFARNSTRLSTRGPFEGISMNAFMRREASHALVAAD
jgi:hypothetical protein